MSSNLSRSDNESSDPRESVSAPKTQLQCFHNFDILMKYEEDERVSLTQQTRLVRFLFVGQFLSGSCHEETAPRALGPTDTEPRRLEEPFQVFVVKLHH